MGPAPARCDAGEIRRDAALTELLVGDARSSDPAVLAEVEEVEAMRARRKR